MRACKSPFKTRSELVFFVYIICTFNKDSLPNAVEIEISGLCIHGPWFGRPEKSVGRMTSLPSTIPGRTLDKCRKHSPAARVFYISLVFSNDHRVLSQCNTQLRLLYLLNRLLLIRISELLFDSHQSTKLDTYICLHNLRTLWQGKISSALHMNSTFSRLWFFVCVLGEYRPWTWQS